MPLADKINSFIGLDALKDYELLSKQIFAEFLGTFLYLSIFLYTEAAESSTAPIELALGHGLAIASIVQIIGHISGGHINPAVTIGVLISGHIELIRAVFYIIAQIFGGMAGAATCYAITHYRNFYGVITPSKYLEAYSILCMEILTTFMVVGVAISVIDMNKGIKGLGSGPLAMGFSVAACQCLAHSTTWSVNPARTLGPAIVANEWTHHWVYWAGPIIGSISAGLIYRFTLTTYSYSNKINLDDE